ncbi:MAG: tRNA (adenosine(37)-N6)-dimethylallyltransferase MiaA [Candidatus Giovannonibacteria bacterium]|nr:tRNA (adenosine(37)-N6)-dimethylallyltransferase MiaA [Candidatus Giovannonibacteria bacterium]
MPFKIVVVVGPNASGKSEFAVRLAKKIGGEIISADSRQVYKGLNIGSGKITKKEMRGVPHHCLSIANPKKTFTALDFKKCAEKAITMIYHSGKTPIIVGGTGFYIDAALGRVKLGGVPPNHALRKKLINYSTAKLLNYLTKLDPKRAKNIEQKNPRRLIRAIEMAKHVLVENLAQRDGASRAIRQQANMRVFGKKHTSLLVQWIGIKHPPEELKKRIHNRLLQRLQGIIRETKQLHKNGVSWKRLFDLGLEYRYVSLYLRKKLKASLSSRRGGITAKAVTKDEMIQKILTESWHYAKRQMTWFKRNKKIKWISNPKSFSIFL